ncbi:hypothetical protein BGX38DRAFT_1178573 [Terfezia claveryi]|nr:hypothetical protein BGX38DRAFT_1178573 [Terfezia claveryi]
MSTNPGRRLRPLAPKLPCDSVSPVLQLEYKDFWNQQTEDLAMRTADVKLQDSIPAQSHIPSVHSSYDCRSDSTVSGLELKQYEVAAPHMNIYSNRRVSLTSATDSLPELAFRNLPAGVATSECPASEPLCSSESYGLSTHHHLSYSGLHFQDTTIQNQHDGNYYTPMLNFPEDTVGATLVQPTISVYQHQSSQPIFNQLPIFTQHLMPLHLPYLASLQPNSQHVACVTCPSIWRSHFESITFSHSEDKGMCNIRRSYQLLQQHVHAAHPWQYGYACALCENLFCFHLGKMMLLEAAKGDFTDVKIDLGNSFMTLRQHIEEAHGGC